MSASSVKFYSDLFDQIEKINLGQSGGEDQELSAIKTVAECFDISFSGKTSLREKAYSEVLIPTLNRKLVRTQDFETMLLPSVSQVMEEKRNEFTPFLNFLESQPEVEYADDFEHQWNDYDIGTTEAGWIDHQTETGSEAKSRYPKDSNTVGCLATKIIMSELSMNVMSKQRNINILNKETGAAVTRIRNAEETYLLSNTEVTFEGPVPIPQPGGFYTRSDVSPLDLNGDDLTAPTLRGLVSEIANISAQNGRGFRQLALLTNEQQVQVIADIITNENNGIFPTDRVAFENYLKTRMAAMKVPVQAVFESRLGPSIPVILTPRLPANTSLLFETELPRLVKMLLGASEGPYAAMRPTELFQRVEVVFDFISQKDPLRETRRRITEVNG